MPGSTLGMAVLAAGVALWWAAHLWKRAAPAHRARFGESGKGVAAGALAVSIALMIVGYRAGPNTLWWSAGPALKGVNNLLVLASFYLFAASGAHSWAGRRLRHPQLLGFLLWAFAHLLVNGDPASLLLFGGLGLWAVVEMVVINRAAPDWRASEAPVSFGKEAGVALAALVVFGLVGLIHGWIGPRPWGA
jgi:uncharacterized membrane protein